MYKTIKAPKARKAAAEIGLLYYQNEDYNRAIEAYKHVITQYPGSEEARLAMRDLKSIYVDANRVDEYAALAAQMPGQIRFEASEQDSLTYIAAEKVYMKGEIAPAKASFDYMQANCSNSPTVLMLKKHCPCMQKSSSTASNTTWRWPTTNNYRLALLPLSTDS